MLNRNLDPQPWRDDAACKGDDLSLFFNGFSNSAARRRCATCPVQRECLRYALSDPDLTGVWAGTTEKERDKMRRHNPGLARWARRRPAPPFPVELFEDLRKWAAG